MSQNPRAVHQPAMGSGLGRAGWFPKYVEQAPPRYQLKGAATHVAISPVQCLPFCEIRAIFGNLSHFGNFPRMPPAARAKGSETNQIGAGRTATSRRYDPRRCSLALTSPIAPALPARRRPLGAGVARGDGDRGMTFGIRPRQHERLFELNRLAGKEPSLTWLAAGALNTVRDTKRTKT